MQDFHFHCVQFGFRFALFHFGRGRLILLTYILKLSFLKSDLHQIESDGMIWILDLG